MAGMALLSGTIGTRVAELDTMMPELLPEPLGEAAGGSSSHSEMARVVDDSGKFSREVSLEVA